MLSDYRDKFGIVLKYRAVFGDTFRGDAFNNVVEFVWVDFASCIVGKLNSEVILQQLCEDVASIVFGYGDKTEGG